MSSSFLLIVVLTAVTVIVGALAVSRVLRAAAEGALSSPRRDTKDEESRATVVTPARAEASAGAFPRARARRMRDVQPKRPAEVQVRAENDEEPAPPVDEEPVQAQYAMTTRAGDGDDAAVAFPEAAELAEPASPDLATEPASSDLPTERSSLVMMNSRPSKREELDERVEQSDHAEREARQKHDEGAPYLQVGNEVSGILIAAEQAAAEIRATAVREVDQAKQEAEQYASALRTDAEARRAEATTYSETERREADAYVEDVRRRADEQSVRTLAEAEERARLIIADARRKAAELEADGRRRGEELSRVSESAEARVASVLTAFRTVTGQLEALLPEQRSEPQAAEERRDPESAASADELSDERLDEAVREVSNPGS